LASWRHGARQEPRFFALERWRGDLDAHGSGVDPDGEDDAE
jgi:hypothetical protein